MGERPTVSIYLEKKWSLPTTTTGLQASDLRKR